jgi:dTMP kinase
MTCTGQRSAASWMAGVYFSRSTSDLTRETSVTSKTCGAVNWHEPQLIHPGFIYTFFIYAFTKDRPHLMGYTDCTIAFFIPYPIFYKKVIMQQLKRGILIAIEGIDGCGKSTLARTLHAACQPLEPKAEYLLFAADRAEHFTKIIIPALRNNQLIISDRMGDSSIAYQGYGRGLDIHMIEQVNTWTMNHIKPDLILYITIDPLIAQERIKARNEALTRFEQEDIDFIHRLAQGFDTLFQHRKEVITLDGTHSVQQLTQTALTAIITWLHSQQLITQ